MIKLIKFALIQIGFLLSFTAAGFATELNLPEMGVPSHDTLSPQNEKRLGRAFMRAVSMQTRLFGDQASLAYLRKVGGQLTAHAKPKHDFSFFMVQDPSINAFAGPGGFVGINTGLVTTAKNEAELAAVLAHEITHVTQRHIARGAEHASESTWPSVGAIVAALLLGGKLDTAVTSGAILTAAAGKMQHTINYTRRFEREADRIGMRVLFDSGFDPTAMPRFFARMQHRTLDFSDPTLKLLRTHPVTEERIADSQNRVRFYSPKPTQINASFPLIKSRITVLTAPTRHDILRRFQKQWQAGNQAPGITYGYALALIRNHQADKAIPLLDKLYQNTPNQPLFSLSLAEAQNAAHMPEAQQTLAKAYGHFPENTPIQLAYAKTLLDYKHANKARLVLLNHQKDNALNPQYFALLAQAQGQSHQLIEAYQSRAQSDILNNNLERAITQLEQAAALATHKPQLRHKLRTAVAKLQNELTAISEL